MKTFTFIATNTIQNRTTVIRVRASDATNAVQTARFEAICNNGFSAFGLSLEYVSAR
jgi:hypothetical protein